MSCLWLFNFYLISIDILWDKYCKRSNVNQIGSFNTGIEGAAEITAYDRNSQRLLVVNAEANAIDVLDLSNPNNPTKIFDIALTSGSPNSVAVHNGIVAVAVADNTSTENGSIAFFDSDGTFVRSIEVGVLPDMLTFTPDGSKVLVANEGEPSDDYTVDPEGSISIIDLETGEVTTASFTDFNDRKQALIASGVRIFGLDATVAQDLEPEYIAISADGNTAFVTLQENNAFAVVDIASSTVTDIIPLGFKDYSKEENSLDPSNRDDGINLGTFDNLFGIYQPDAIASYQANGQTYYITANEGDARDYEGFTEEFRVGDEEIILDPEAFPNASELLQESVLGRLRITNTLGDTDNDGDFDELYSYGGRSFSIWDSKGALVFDSGNDIAEITANLVPELFNSQGDTDSFDSRSDDKGAEPEGVVTGVVEGKTYAFIGLERIGGVMVYDVSNPVAPEFIQYVRTEGDVSPEGLTFIPAEDSPNSNPLLVVANEVSGSTTIYEINSENTNNMIFINEVDADTAGSDTAEFVELYDGGVGNTALDGLSLVFFNGNSNNESYAVFDLDGFTTNGDGFFVLGNPGVANVDLIFDPGGSGALQNGADAVALYQADAADFPNGTVATTTNLLDAIAYDTNDSDDADLLTALGLATQFNEGENGNKDGDSNSRVPDGTGDFIAQAPTPGTINQVVTPNPEITINEVDADTAGTDAAEFVELYDGGVGNIALDGLSVVFFNGSDDASYEVFDLDGFSTNADGFFVLGNSGVANVDLVFGNNTLQNGADAVALYQGDAADFPNDTPATSTNLVDAIVYDTNDSDDSGLLTALGLTTQFNEGANGNQDSESNSRVPDSTGDFVAQAPTPGAINQPTSSTVPIFEIQGAAQTSPLEAFVTS